MKRKFKVQGDTKNTFMNIELDLIIEDDNIGSKCNVLGGEFIITQNGPILVLVDKEWCLTLMDITPEKVTEKPKLVINETLEIFFNTKEIQVKVECTYEELYYALETEWKLAGKLSNTALPCDYTGRLKLFTFYNDWKFAKDSFKFLTNGSVTYINSQGRCS